MPWNASLHVLGPYLGRREVRRLPQHSVNMSMSITHTHTCEHNVIVVARARSRWLRDCVMQYCHFTFVVCGVCLCSVDCMNNIIYYTRRTRNACIAPKPLAQENLFGNLNYQRIAARALVDFIYPRARAAQIVCIYVIFDLKQVCV